MKYIYERKKWPEFTWDRLRIMSELAQVRHNQGRLLGRMEGLGFQLRTEASLTTLTEDVVKSSQIEGESLERLQVRSSISRRLGLDVTGLPVPERDVEGIVEVMLDATQNAEAALTSDRLFGWHAALFPAGRSGTARIRTGIWRDDKNGPMQVISGAVGRQRVHFQAPAADRLKTEMKSFLTWFNDKAQVDPVLKAAQAHLWFITLHPFDDGNGRLARAITDMALARSENSSQRFYSMSGQICRDRKAYYEILEKTQKADLDVTEPSRIQKRFSMRFGRKICFGILMPESSLITDNEQCSIVCWTGLKASSLLPNGLCFLNVLKIRHLETLKS
jgi:Fic family protein